MLTQAKQSIGQNDILDALSLELKMLLDQLEFIENQILVLDNKIKIIVENWNTKITTIPGIGNTLAGVILGEIGDINRFADKKKLVAFAGLDASVRESGESKSTRNHISKRGSIYLRTGFWQAAVAGLQHNQPFKEFYERKKKEGKCSQVALGACARKLCELVFSILKNNREYDSEYLLKRNKENLS